jgi:sulfur carrier protein
MTEHETAPGQTVPGETATGQTAPGETAPGETVIGEGGLMDIVINGERREVGAGVSLAGAVALVTAAATGVAAAVNGDVVRRGAWESTRLGAGDEVEVVTAVQGG